MMIMSALLATTPSAKPPSLVELSSIVEPYARCELARQPKFKALQEEWSIAAKRQVAEPTDKATAARADELMNGLIAARARIRVECGYEQTHQQLRDRLAALHPRMESHRAYWLARSVFNSLNILNAEILKLKAGILPPAPPAPSGMRNSGVN